MAFSGTEENISFNGPQPPHFTIFQKVKRSAYVMIDLDAITYNLRVLRSCYENPHTGVIAVVKAGAYGLGSVHVARHVKATGVERLAVATVGEAIYLRNHGITGPILVLGVAEAHGIDSCVQYNLLPSLSSSDTVRQIASALESTDENRNVTYGTQESHPRGAVNIKVDTGLSRFGCQPNELRQIIQSCEDSNVPIDAIYTQFADSTGNAEFTKQQYDLFLETVEPFRNKNISLHIANAGAIMNGIGTDLDFVRPGIMMYGLPPGDVADFKGRVFRPAVSVKAVPSLVKCLPEGRKVGYSCTYTTTARDGEWIATFPLGFADGYWRYLSNRGFIVRDKTGEKCPIVGRTSMDAITVRLPCSPEDAETYSIITADFDPDTSVTGIASKVGSIPSEVLTRLSVRYPRIYIANQTLSIAHELGGDNY